jgi:hypothetical protein
MITCAGFLKIAREIALPEGLGDGFLKLLGDRNAPSFYELTGFGERETNINYGRMPLITPDMIAFFQKGAPEAIEGLQTILRPPFQPLMFHNVPFTTNYESLLDEEQLHNELTKAALFCTSLMQAARIIPNVQLTNNNGTAVTYVHARQNKESEGSTLGGGEIPTHVDGAAYEYTSDVYYNYGDPQPTILMLAFPLNDGTRTGLYSMQPATTDFRQKHPQAYELLTEPVYILRNSLTGTKAGQAPRQPFPAIKEHIFEGNPLYQVRVNFTGIANGTQEDPYRMTVIDEITGYQRQAYIQALEFYKVFLESGPYERGFTGGPGVVHWFNNIFGDIHRRPAIQSPKERHGIRIQGNAKEPNPDDAQAFWEPVNGLGFKLGSGR